MHATKFVKQKISFKKILGFENVHRLTFFGEELRYTQGLREGGSGGTSYPGPGLGGPGLRGAGRVEVVAFSFGPKVFSSLPILRP